MSKPFTMWSDRKKAFWGLSITAVLLAIIIVTFLVAGFLIPRSKAKNTMDPNGTLTVLTLENGTLQVEWPAGENVHSYALQVLEADGALLHSAITAECVSILPELPTDRELVVRVTSSHNYGLATRKGDKALEMTLRLIPTQIQNLHWLPDVEQSTVDVDFGMPEGSLCRVYVSTGDGEPVLAEEVHDGKLQLKFGDGEKYSIPAYGEPLRFTFQLEHNVGNISYLSDPSTGFTLTREDMLSKTLTVECTDNGENSYTLTWNETKGEYYEVLLSTNGGESWQTLVSIPCDQERTYTTDHLNAYTDYTLWVVAVGGQTMPNSEFAAVSQQMQLRTGAKLLYSTIWPLMDIRVFSDAEGTQELGQLSAGSAWCVLGLEGKFFKIRYDGRDAYINSEYCMINLPEYIGNLCLYDITNSYSSIYLVHEYGINRVSGTVIPGYENVKISDGQYLVPLLFPTAQKLIAAGEEAQAQGYTLKIYDAYRPKVATEKIYSLTYAIMGNRIPSYTYSGKVVRDLYLLRAEPEEEEEEEKPKETKPTAPPADDPAESPTEAPASPEVTPTTPPVEDSAGQTAIQQSFIDLSVYARSPSKSKSGGLTYQDVMTNRDEYRLGQFLAPGISRHNFGVALDLTLVDSNGNDLPMQTSMHDLSWYSVFKRNNANANTLYYIMRAGNLQNITSEWWHYQDNETYETHKYDPLQNGVSFECWVTDGHGWRYRLADGSFYTNCTQAIDNQSYTFDELGYIVQ